MVALFVALMFVGLVLTDLAVEKWRVWQKARAARSAASVRAMEPQMLWQVPEGVHLSGVHTWFRPDPAGGLEIGADALIAYAVGTVRKIVLPKPGDHVTAGQPLFQLEREGRAVTVPFLVTGQVMAVNSRLVDQPELLSSDPYGSGWVCHLNPTRVEGAAPIMRFGEAAVTWLENEFVRFREFIVGQISPDLALGVTSQDGGLPAVGSLSELDAKAWSAFEADFLRRP
jgi:glycine cleavage system H protein